jgi:hypothetical protein
VQFSYLLDKNGVCACDVFNPLSLHWRGRKAGKIDGVPGPECFANLAQLLEAADPWSLSGARIYDVDGTLALIDLDTLRRNDADQRVVDRTRQLVASHHQLAVVDQNGSHPVRQHLLVLVAALAEDVQEQHRPLQKVTGILTESS